MSVYCSAPWAGITVREDGLVRTCCVGQKVIANLNEQPVETIEQSPVLRSIRDQMISGQADPENCRICIDQEQQAGAASLRSYYRKYYSEIDADRITPSVIDIRWNNTCNLGCVYCNPRFSSTWADRMEVKNLRPVKDYQDDLLEWILQRVEHVREIQLVGGEPLLMKQNYRLLANLPQNCKISIITNLSYDLESLPCFGNLLDRPPGHVIWNISAENIGNKFEYVRTGASWKQFQINLESLVRNFPETQSINMVYNLLSAMDLPETVAHYMDLGIKKFVLQPLIGQPGMNIFLMPQSIRDSARDQFEIAMDYHRSQIHPEDRDFYPVVLENEIRSQLNQTVTGEIITKKEFQECVALMDRWNNNKFSDLWPDLAEKLDRCLI